MKRVKAHIDGHIYLTDQEGLKVLKDMRISNTYETDSSEIGLIKVNLLNGADLLKQTIIGMEV